jgi:hypothetical protein
MISAKLTDHAALRLAQRALRIDDMELAMMIGTEVEGGIFVRERDSAVAARELVLLAQRIRHMAGLRIVHAGETAVTAYRATRRKQKRLLRHAEERNMEN